MADGKKSVLLYCDLIHTVEKMDNETAGLFFKHYLRYINDLNPTTDNLIVDITFESVKQNLKRDLLKWESRADNSRNNGKLGGRPKKEETQKTQQVNLKPEKPVNVTVTDTVNVNDIKETYRAFAHLSLSIDDYEKLESEYEKRTIDMVLDSIENYKDNKKYKSLYLTAKKWLSKEPKKRSVVEADEWDKDFQVGDVMPNGATLTPDVQHHHNMTGFSYKRLAGL